MSVSTLTMESQINKILGEKFLEYLLSCFKAMLGKHIFLKVASSMTKILIEMFEGNEPVNPNCEMPSNFLSVLG